MAYLDGELPAAEQQLARSHLENCWSCRSRINAVEDSIEVFLGARATILPEEPAFSSNRVEQFRQRLRRHAAEAPQTDPRVGIFAHLSTSLKQTAAQMLGHRQAVIAATVAICLVILMFSDVWDVRVSADTVLSRAQNYDTVHLPAAGQVTSTSVKVERVDKATGAATPLGTITILRDSATPETFLQVESSNGQAVHGTTLADESLTARALHTVLSDSHDDPVGAYLISRQWVPDVSVNGFRQLIAPRGDTRGSAKRDGNRFEVRYPFNPDHVAGIAEARLSVNAKDWQPTSVSIVTSDHQREYRFIKTAFLAEPRTSEIAAMFAPREIAERASARVPELPRARRVIPLSYSEVRASEDEVSASEALHKVDACLGEEVHVFPMSDGSLLVQGLVDSAGRRQAIRQSLKEWGGPLHVEIYLPREVKNGAELFNSPDRDQQKLSSAAMANTTVSSDAAAGTMPMYDRLYEHFLKPGVSSDETQQQVAVFSNQVVTLARQTFLHAWALKKLDSEFSPQRVVGLPGWAVERVEQMRQDHRRSIATLAKRQSEMLSSIAGPTVLSEVSSSAGQLDSEALLRLAQQQDDLVRALFTTSQQASASDASLAQLLSLLRRIGT